MDRAVLEAYGWVDIPVPPSPDRSPTTRRPPAKPFEDDVLDRLFALNAERAAEERRLGNKRTAKSQ